MSKKPILHLYPDKESMLLGFDNFIHYNTNTIEKIQPRDLLVICKDSSNHFVEYKDHTTSKQRELCGQWGDIKFNSELPEHIKLHFLSRIRWIEN